jgi:hypothetical protein
MKCKLTLIFFIFCLNVFSQNRNSIWCFGDSAGVDFSNLSTPQPIHSAAKSRGSAVSVSDSTGQLLFYAYTRATIAGNTTLIKNRNNQLMQNGNNVVGQGWYEELTIIPVPGNSSQYYLFSAGVTNSGPQGLYYSVVDMSLNAGLGSVILRNVQLQNYYADDCVEAIRHGNGRDWWIISRQWNTAPSDTFFVYLVTPFGISSPTIFNVGTAVNSNIYHFTFSPSGNKIIAVNTQGLIELFDFDRCTGSISFNQTISTVVTSNLPYYISGAFSPNERYLYVTAWPATSYINYLFQFDLQASNIFNSIDTIWSLAHPYGSVGFLKLAPDNKIYMGFGWQDEMNFNYPYPDSVFNAFNMNLSVVNYPDSPSAACDFQPFSFYLGGNRTYYGLPNNPDYEMGSIAPCDSLTGIEQLASASNSELFVYFHSGWQIAFINAKDLKGKNYLLSVFDLTGREVYKEGGTVCLYYTKDLDCSTFANGMYIVTMQTEKEKLVKRFVKE